jgi:DNA-binding CsgD family transcriptional regulator
MDSTEAFAIFESLTAKQHEALELASCHLTSKQIAQQLGVAPVTIDKRIEAVRAKLGAIPRTSLLRMYGEWRDHDDQTIGDPIILGAAGYSGSGNSGQPSGAATFDARAAWERGTEWRRPGFTPSDLGIVGKLLFMLAGAVAMLMVAVLSMAFAGALMSMFAA